MYTRSYYPDNQERLNIPENYDGTAFSEQEKTETEPSVQQASAIPLGHHDENDQSIFASLGKIPFLSGLFGKGGTMFNSRLKIPEIGTEEILIIATAAFLFFSKEGDKECAMMLILLLLIN